MRIELKFFGAYRAFVNPPVLALDVDEPVTPLTVRAALTDYASVHWPTLPPGLIQSSALATSSDILREGDVIESTDIAVLPPVSGG